MASGEYATVATVPDGADSLSNYTANYTGEALGSRPQSRTQAMPRQQRQLKFEGISLAKASYTGERAAPSENFAPKNTYEAKPEDRDFTSEQRRFGAAGNIPPRMIFRPKDAPLPGHKFEGESTAHASYTGAYGQAASPVRPVQEQAGGRHRFEGTSSYSTNFTGTVAPVVMSMKPDAAVIRTGTFQDTTTNRSAFQPWDAKPVEQFRPIDASQALGENRDFQTESAVKYNDKGVVKRRPFRPEAQALPSAKFEGVSTAKAHFQGTRADIPAAFRPENSNTAKTETRDFVSEAKKQFGSERGYVPPPRLMKPVPAAIANNGSFDDRTTSATTFVRYSDAKPATPIRQDHGPAIRAQPFDGRTSYGQQFVGTVAPVARSMKPESEPVITGVFDDSTTNRTAFQPWNSNPAQKILPRPDGWYMSADVRNNYQTESCTAFNDKGVVVRRSFAPPSIPAVGTPGCI
jgi:hypothetical protein